MPSKETGLVSGPTEASEVQQGQAAHLSWSNPRHIYRMEEFTGRSPAEKDSEVLVDKELAAHKAN